MDAEKALSSDPRNAGGPSISRSVAMKRPQNGETTTPARHLPGKQTSSSAATVAPRPSLVASQRNSSSDASNSSGLRAHTATIDSRLKPAPLQIARTGKQPAQAATNFSRPINGHIERAETQRSAGMRSLAHHRPGDYAAAGIVRPYRGRTLPGVILEESSEVETEELSSPLSRNSSHQTGENVRWSAPAGALRAPVQNRAPTVHSQAGSIIAGSTVAGSSMRRFPRSHSAPTVPRLSTMPQGAALGSPRTLLEMHPRYERTPTFRPAPPMVDWGTNFSTQSVGTSMEDIRRRRAGLAGGFPQPANAVAWAGRERRFAGGPFVDAPGAVGRSATTAERERERVAASSSPSQLAVPKNANGEIVGTRKVEWGSSSNVNGAGEEEVAKAEKKQGKWKRVSGFFAKKFSRKGKKGSSSSDPSSGSSPEAAGSSPSLLTAAEPPSRPALRITIPEAVQNVIAEEDEPVTPLSAPDWARLHARNRGDDTRSVSPLSRKPEGCDQDAEEDDVTNAVLRERMRVLTHAAQQTHLEEDIMSFLGNAQSTAPVRRSEELMPVDEREEELLEEDSSPLQDLDPEIFPSPLNVDKRWTRSEPSSPVPVEQMEEALQDEADWSGSQHASLLSSEEMAEAIPDEADWSGTGSSAGSQGSAGILEAKHVVLDKGKGKAQLVDIDEEKRKKPKLPSRYHHRPVVASAPVSESGREETKKGREDSQAEVKDEDGRTVSDAESWKTAQVLQVKRSHHVLSDLGT